MNRNGIFWKNSIFTRIVVTFVIILVPLYVLGFLEYNSAVQTVRREISGSMTAQVSFYMENLEKEIQRIRYLQYDLINDTDLNRLSAIPESMDDIGRMEAIINLQNRMDAIRNSSMYIRNVSVHIPAINRSLSAVGLIDEFDSDRYAEMMEAYHPADFVHYLSGEPVMLAESAFMEYGDIGNPMFIIEIELDRAAFSQALLQFDKYENSGVFLYSTAMKFNLAQNGTDTGIQSQILSGITDARQGSLTLKSHSDPAFAVYANSSALEMTLGLHVADSVVFHPVQQYSFWFILFTLVAAGVIASFTFSLYRWIRKPMRALISSFKKVEDGDLDVSMQHHHKDEFGFLYERFNGMVENIRNLIEQVYTMKILAQKAELKQLQSQINPHFLYNSFFILHRRIKGGDYENAVRFSQQLGNYFRFITKSASDEVPLVREIEHAIIYADIQQTRFSKRIRIQVETLPVRYEGLIVPYLILQPILENAFEHGLQDKEEDGLLTIRYEERAEDQLAIIVEDNGNGIGDEELRQLQQSLNGESILNEHTGLVNIHRRLRIKFGSTAGLTLMRTEPGGFRVELGLSVRTDPERPYMREKNQGIQSGGKQDDTPAVGG